MNHLDQMKAVETRAFNARINMGDLLRIAKVAHSTWSRAKKRQFIRARTLEKVEGAIAWYEQQRAERPE